MNNINGGIKMDVEFETECEVGKVDVDCPFCNGEGYYYVKNAHPLKGTDLDEKQCFMCKGAGLIEVYVGEVTVSGTIEIEPPDHSWRD